MEPTREEFGPEPFEDAESAVEFVHDVIKIASVDDTVLRNAVATLAKTRGLLTTTRFHKTIQSCIEDADAIVAIERLVSSLDPSKQDEILEFLERASEDLKIEPLDLPVLRDKLGILWSLEPRISELQKSYAIARATGSEIISLGLICDSRPVYDDDRSKILGFVPIVQGSIGYVTASGQKDTLELTLTEYDIEFMVESLLMVQRKLAVLKATIDQSNGVSE